MNITFRQGSDDLSSTVAERARTKLSTLSRLVDEENAEAYAYVDVERESGATNSPDRWRTSINLELPGNRFNAVATGETPEKATEVAIKELKQEVRKARGKRRSLARRGQEILKRLRRSTPA